MGYQADDIAHQISEQRQDLDRNLQALRDRAERAMNWRAHWEQRPVTLLGIAFGGGALLSLLTGRRRGGAPVARESRRRDNVRGALPGVAATRLTGTL